MRKIHIIIALLIPLLLFSCKKDELQVSKLQIDSETIVKDVNYVVITVNYTYPANLKSVVGYVSSHSDMSGAKSVNAEVNGKTFVIKFSNLNLGTKYYYYYEYDNGVDVLKTDVNSFLAIIEGLPEVTTSEVTEIYTTTATCGGEVTNDGGLTVKARGVCWGKTPNPNLSDSHTTDGTGTGHFTSHLTELSKNTTYYVRAYATNDKGTSYGEQKMFTTLSGLLTVTTNEVTNITANSATCGGNVTDDFGVGVSVKGICWNTRPDPTIYDNSTVFFGGGGTGSYTCNMTGLKANNLYYVRAYAKSSDGIIVYGNQVTFSTLNPNIPAGAVAGLFSVSPTKQVFVAKGNLRYKASTNEWRFAERQYHIIGHGNNHVSPTYNDWIDLFYWGTSGYDHGAVCYQPWSTSNRNEDYYAYGSSSYNLFDQTGKADWGYNAISNGGNAENMWRSLTREEWNYMMFTRDTGSGIRYAKATVNGIKGLVVVQDNWNNAVYALNNTNQYDSTFDTNIISAEEWDNILEVNGAVFLPFAGTRDQTMVNNLTFNALYWLSSLSVNGGACCGGIYEEGIYVLETYWRNAGLPVRLVQDYDN